MLLEVMTIQFTSRTAGNYNLMVTYKKSEKKVAFFHLESSEQNLWTSLVPDPTTKYILQNDLYNRVV